MFAKDITKEEEALRLLATFEDVKGMKLLKAFTIPRSLSKVGAFDSLKHAADARGFILAGDYCEMPSLQGALVSGEKAAVLSLI